MDISLLLASILISINLYYSLPIFISLPFIRFSSFLCIETFVYDFPESFLRAYVDVMKDMPASGARADVEAFSLMATSHYVHYTTAVKNVDCIGVA